MNKLKKILYMSYNYFKNNFSNKINDDHIYLVESPCIIESKTTDTSWYRVWSDGWCEQGGIIDVAKKELYTITFEKPFKTEPVYVSSNIYNQTTTSTSDKNWLTVNLNITKDNFVLRYWDSDGNTWRTGLVSWEAKGLVKLP